MISLDSVCTLEQKVPKSTSPAWCMSSSRIQAVLVRPEWIYCLDPRLVLPTILRGKLGKPGLLPVGTGILQFRAFLPICALVLQGWRHCLIHLPTPHECAVSFPLVWERPRHELPIDLFLFIPAGWNSHTSVPAPSSSRHWVTAPLSSGFASSPGAGLCSLTQWCHSWPTALRSSCATCLWENLLPFAKISSSPLSGGECGKGWKWDFWSFWRFISIPLLAKVYMAWSSCSKELIGNV